MEVMSCLLLCALVALLPQALGKQVVRSVNPSEIKFNTTLMIHQKPFSSHKILINLNGQRMILKLSELQTVFDDVSCHKCVECMKRALRAHRSHSYLRNRTASEEWHKEILTNTISRRDKRDIGTTLNADLDTSKKDKKSKQKKSKPQKSVSVTKYNMDGEIFALKVKESNTSTDDQSEKMFGVTCQVYSIKKSFPCDSPEGDVILAVAKRKTSKKDKKEKETTTPKEKTTKKPEIISSSAVFRKRHVENYQNSQLPENVMPSIEEFY